MKVKIFKSILAAVLVCIMLTLGLAGCASPNKDWEDIGPKGKMLIGITDYPPMNYKDADGKWIGFESEFAEAVCAILGVQAEFVEINWDSKEAELKAKNIDCIWNGMTITDERAKAMDISERYMNNRQVLIVKAENKDKYKTADDLAGAVLVAEQGSTMEEFIKSNEFFAKASYTAVDRQITGFMEVKAGTADITVTDYVMAIDMLKAGGDYTDLVLIDENFPAEEFGIAFRKNSPDTVAKVNAAIDELKSNGKLQEIADKYGLGDLLK